MSRRDQQKFSLARRIGLGKIGNYSAPKREGAKHIFNFKHIFMVHIGRTVSRSSIFLLLLENILLLFFCCFFFLKYILNKDKHHITMELGCITFCWDDAGQSLPLILLPLSCPPSLSLFLPSLSFLFFFTSFFYL